MSEKTGWLNRNAEVLFHTAILILGAYLRFPDLGRESFWGDEIMLAKAAVLPTLGETVADVQIPHSVGYPVFLHYWMRIGTAEEMVRFPSAVAGVLSIFLLFQLVKQVSCARVGFVAALLLALAAPQIRFSREAAAYSIQNAVLIGAGLVWIRALQNNRWSSWIAFSLLATLCHYLHPLASTTTVGWYLLALLVWVCGAGAKTSRFFMDKGSVNLRRWFTSGALFGALILPQTLRNMEGAARNVLTSATKITFADFWEELVTLLGGHWWPLFPLIVVGLISLFRTSVFLGLAFTGWACGTLAVWGAFSWAQSYHFDYHYFLSHLPALIALAAFGIEGALQGLSWIESKTLKSASSKWIGPATVVAAGVVGFLILPSGIAERERSWPNYRDAGAFLAYRLNPEDCYYVKPDNWLPAKIGYYLRDVADQRVGIEVFTDGEVQREIDERKGTLYIVTPQAFRRSSLYISRSFHGAAINWRDPCDDSPLDYWDTYERMQSSAGEVTATDLLSHAKEFEEVGELETACGILIEAASRSPHLYAIQRRKAEVFTKLGRYREAVASYQAAFERAPRGDRWWMLVGESESYLSLGMKDQGLEALHRALQETTDESEDAFVHEAIGNALLDQGRIDEAEAAFQKSLELWEGDREISLMGLGEIAEKRGDIPAAIGLYTRVTNLESSQSEPAQQRIRDLRGQ